MRVFRIAAFAFLALSLVMVLSYNSKDSKEIEKGISNVLAKALPEKEIEELQKANERLKVRFEEIEKENDEIRKREEKLKEKLQKTEEEKTAVEADLQKSQKELEKKGNCPNQESGLSVFEKREVVCKNPDSKGRPIFIFVVGGEGTGHHLVANLVDKFPGVQRLSRHVQQLFAEMWEPAINEERRFTKRQELVTLLKEVSDDAMADKSKGTHFVIQTSNFDMYSFPYDEPRNPLRRPDVIDLISLVEPLFDLRILVTTRDPMSSIVSLIRRKWWTLEMCEQGVPVPTRKVRLYTEGPLGECGYIPVQARVVEDALVYINAQMLAVSREYFQTFRYEDFLEDSERFVAPLAKFLGFQPGEISEHVTSHVQKRKEDYTQMLSEKQRETITSLFSGEKRPHYWKGLERDDWHILNFDASDRRFKEEEICFS